MPEVRTLFTHHLHEEMHLLPFWVSSLLLRAYLVTGFVSGGNFAVRAAQASREPLNTMRARSG